MVPIDAFVIDQSETQYFVEYIRKGVTGSSIKVVLSLNINIT